MSSAMLTHIFSQIHKAWAAWGGRRRPMYSSLHSRYESSIVNIVGNTNWQQYVYFASNTSDLSLLEVEDIFDV